MNKPFLVSAAFVAALAAHGCSSSTTTYVVVSEDAGASPAADASAEGSAPEVVRPSCAAAGAGAGTDCGHESDTNCCASSAVPGGKFYRWKDRTRPGAQTNYPATVSPFSLDVFEITVGRFRRFADEGNGTRKNPPKEGSGVHPRIPGSGWKSAYNALLPADRIALDTELTSRKPVTVWTQGAGPHERRPMKGLSWALASAFCAWDGGRLPTAAEWNFAAVGGDEHRPFPWGNTLARDKATYDCRDSGADIGCDPEDLLFVGSKPPGKGRWGHFDLVGSLFEWVADSDDQRMPCNDCGVVDPTSAFTIVLGGSFWSSETDEVHSSFRRLKDRPEGDFDLGARCARDL